MTTRDRKDVPDPSGGPHVPAPETHTDRQARKEWESDAPDQALAETFPTSDPVSPFVPAMLLEPVHSESQLARVRACAHDACACEVKAPEMWCSDTCKESQQGYQLPNRAACGCGHSDCGVGA